MRDSTFPADLVGLEGVRHETCPRGTVLFRQGDAAGDLFVLRAGSIALFRESQGRRNPIATLRPGEMFGDMAVIDGSVRRSSAVALEDCELLVIAAGALQDKLAAAPAVLRLMLRLAADNLRQVHDSYAPQSRSLLDAVGSLSRQHDVVTKFMRANVTADLREGFDARLRALEVLIKDIRRLAMAHRQQDRRDDAIPHEADLPL